ncbi:Rab-GAP TBC domain-containing protein [Mycena indigotica]|uniref:Rab-GAP TBC domain-containing protein n=1 Tax=Mycena indigotica TaxID=2126181 RepID=A0A8H6S8C7_9AGAR|nr:Rab-GAP TBC domain-containing protein [Mycena indigotica]KAF7294733.1 Rab-GAP TBC domain-containing protein [Mycena indigotica]
MHVATRQMDATELARWTRFAAKGGIGKATAIGDCVAEAPDELMFLKNDEIVVLLQFTDEDNMFLGFCEGIVGRFRAADVYFHSKLKKPVMTKRSSVSSGKLTPTPSIVAPSPVPSPKSDVSFQTAQARYQPNSSEALSPSSSLSSTSPPLSHSVSSSSSGTIVDTPTSLYPSPEPITQTQPLDTSAPATFIETNVDGQDKVIENEESEVAPGRNRRSETAAVEMWPSSPSTTLSRKPVNGSRLALAMETVNSDESESEHHSPKGDRDSDNSSSDERYSPEDEEGGWANVPATLPLQVVKLNTPNSAIPPSPYQPMFFPPSSTSSDNNVESQSLSSASGTDTESEYDSSDPEDQDTTTKFPVPPDRRSLSPTSPRIIDTSRRSSASSTQDPSRLSIAAPSVHSEDGEVGIGLSLLQGLAAAGEDASDDEDLIPPVRARDEARRSISSSVRSGQDWDGASIYDNYYRFSRSRSSGSTFASLRMAPQIPHGSQRGVEDVPPVPADLRHDSESERSRPREDKRRSADSDASVYTQASKVSSIDHTRLTAEPLAKPPSKHRPASLDLLNSNGEPSPLLHTRWGSPNSSMSPPSSSGAQTAFFNPTSGGLPSTGSSGSNSPGGAASILRQRLELERGSPAGSNYAEMEPREEGEGGLGSGIVIDDDEEPPQASMLDGPTSESPDEDGDETVEGEDTVEGINLEELQEKPGLAPLVITEDSVDPPTAVASPSATNSTSPHSPRSSAATTPLSPSSPPDISPPPSQQPLTSNHQPKPSLSELRGYMSNHKASEFDQPAQRTSLFLPHPNAPKAPPPTSGAEGPMYIRPAPPPSQQRSESVVNIIRMSIGRSAVTRVSPTIYGRIEGDLTSATGPVRVTFSIDPPPPVPQLPSRIPFRNGVASPAPAPPLPSGAPPRPAPRRAATMSESDPKPPSTPSPSTTVVPSPASSTPSISSPLASASANPAPPEPRTGAIPRPNFFPKVGTSRPRSRSFSGFNTSHISPPMPISKEDPGRLSAQKPSRSMSSLAAPVAGPSSSSSQPTPPPTSSLGKHASRSSLRPSPLSLPQNNSVLGGRSPTSPLATSFTPSSPVTARPHQLRQASSRSTLNEGRPSLSRQADAPGASPIQERPSVDVGGLAPSREALRTKLSLPNLRRMQSRQSSDSPSPTVQHDNMDFELVMPNRAMFDQASGRTSEDSTLGREASIDGRTSEMRRTDSPALSITSTQAYSGSDNNSVDAHRQREQKWLTLIGIVSPAQAKKSKKVKKLLMDGSVPSSVRFLVWLLLTDGKGKAIPGVYAQLGKRARVAALDIIERDVQRCFADHPHMHSSQSSLVTLLQAYLTMVPDVQYSRGLTLIAGHLLALSPEEDAFWIFVSVMDSYLRPYFSSSTTQLEVDASLFSRALEANDPQLGKKILVELGINPVDLCRPWFSTLFSDALPLEYLNRVWDLFLFEGIPFLFRVSLALFHCCRRRLLEARSPDALFDILAQPPTPPSPDALITMALAVKLKDDDIRKSREKQRAQVEAQMKRQTQGPRPSTVSARSLSGSRQIGPPI